MTDVADFADEASKYYDNLDDGMKVLDDVDEVKATDGAKEVTGKSDSNTKIIAGKNFKDHFIRHKSLLENVTGKKYSKYKTHGQEFLDDIGKIIDDGEFITILESGKGLDLAIQIID